MKTKSIFGFKSYVYLIGYDTTVKIGKSNDVNARLSNLQTANPVELHIIGVMGCKSETDALELESFLHEKYSKDNLRGEWFYLPESEQEHILATYGHPVTSIPSEDILSGLKELSSGAFKLLIYYYGRDYRFDWSSTECVPELKLSSRQLKLYRNELMYSGYLLVISGDLLDMLYLGKATVCEFKETFPSVSEQIVMQ